MQCWDVLEIEATNNRRDIKRAYAKKLKVTHPEQDPEAFQQLSEAYKEALTLSHYIELEEAEPLEAVTAEDTNETLFSEASTHTSEESESNLATTKTTSEEAEAITLSSNDVQVEEENSEEANIDRFIESFMSALETLANDEQRRTNSEQWVQLLEDPMLDYLEVKEVLRYEVFYFFSQSILYDQQQIRPITIPEKARHTYSDFFGWKDDEVSLTRHFQFDQIEAVLASVGSRNSQRLENANQTQAEEKDGSTRYGFLFWFILIFALVKFMQFLTRDDPKFSSEYYTLDNKTQWVYQRKDIERSPQSDI
ncbi:J domain-containing protein [Pleionea sp. CnH1-48]|uniref:J domain-containing protein n=1 Tax=Pleionea sp. CnH1-48 TaxID=2954494 RepID=UPI002096DCFE|nr:J domain-containing protein [Pleionea sp. CnH1-48]MCO7222801.1 J domain-containing protein [Pleionea sp. CnH1-48]